MATFYNLDQRKIQNMRRDPRVVLSFQAKEYSGQGLWPYAVVQGRVREITEGGALEVMDRLAEFYIGPGQRYPMRAVPDGLVVHVTVERVYGQGAWAQGGWPPGARCGTPSRGVRTTRATGPLGRPAGALRCGGVSTR